MGEVISKRFFVKTLLIAAIYFITVIYLMNFSLVKDTIIGAYTLTYKVNLLLALLEGMWTSMTHSALLLLALNSLLTGAILVLFGQKIVALRQMGKLKIVAGGSSLLAIVGGSCAACGLPILSLLGLSGAVLYLPFKGVELSYLSFALLLGSLYLLVKSTIKTQACSVRKKRE